MADAAPSPTPSPAPPRPTTTALVGRLWRDWMRRYWPVLLANLAAIGVFAGATALYPPAIERIIDSLNVESSGDLAWVLPAIFVIVVIKTLSLYLHKVLTGRVLARVETDLQDALFRRLIDADLAQLAAEPPASLAARFTADIALVRQAAEKLINSLLRDSLTVIALVAAMLWIDWELTLLGVAAFPIAVIPLAAIGRRLRTIAQSTQKEIGSTTALVQESLAGLRMAKTYRIEGYLKTGAASAFERLRGLKVRAANQKALIDPMMELLGGAAVLLVVAYVGARIASGANTLGDVAAFIFALATAAQPMRALGNLNAQLQQGLVGAARIFELLDAPPLIADKPGAPPLRVSAGAIRLEDVSFAYEPGAAALDGFTLDIPGGARVALVGRSGSGKSTVLNLLPRLYDVTAGRVSIDGQDLREVTAASLRDAIALVSQEAVLFNDSVAANIGFGRQDADAAAIEAAARAAAAHDFIAELPGGYDAPVGERGDRLSGGQRQRIAIARAFLRDAPILLLDEATSALDAESETAVKAAIERLSEGRTTLIIAHRLSTILDADKIVVLDAGRVVEDGRHEDLLAKGGLYATLYRLQFGGG